MNESYVALSIRDTSNVLSSCKLIIGRHLTAVFLNSTTEKISSDETLQLVDTVIRGNFDWQGNFDRLCSFVKGATVPIHKCLFAASAFMEIND